MTQTASENRTTGRRRSVLAVVLIVLGLVLGTSSIIAAFAKTQLSDTEAFVSTFGPLAADPKVQEVVIGAVNDAIDESVDFGAITGQVFDGIVDLGLPGPAERALRLLEAPAAQGMQTLAHSAVEQVVTSEAFADIWVGTLRLGHSQVMAILSGDEDTLVTISPQGVLAVQIGPIVEAVRERLLDNGVSFAVLIPDTDRKIVITENASLGQLTTLHATVISVGSWLPWVALALVLTGVLVAKNRRRTLLITAATTAVVMFVVWLALSLARAILMASLGRPPLSEGAVQVVFDATTGYIFSTVITVGIIAVVVAFVAWLMGPGRIPVALRTMVTRPRTAAVRLS